MYHPYYRHEPRRAPVQSPLERRTREELFRRQDIPALIAGFSVSGLAGVHAGKRTYHSMEYQDKKEAEHLAVGTTIGTYTIGSMAILLVYALLRSRKG